jgi:hypothetical protein
VLSLLGGAFCIRWSSFLPSLTRWSYSLSSVPRGQSQAPRVRRPSVILTGSMSLGGWPFWVMLILRLGLSEIVSMMASPVGLNLHEMAYQ